MSGGALLQAQSLVAGYGAIEVVHGISLQVQAGSLTALIGANGAGKTTLMKALAGLLPLQGGSLRFMGQDITYSPCDQRVFAGLVLVPEGRMVFPSLSVAENLRLGGVNPRARPAWRRSMEHVFHVFPKLEERQAQQASTLSGGEQQMLAIGRGLMAQPRLMLLDEPTLGLAPVMALKIFELVQRLRADGLTLLLAEQDVLRTLQCASTAYVIENGRVALEGPAQDIGADPRVKQAYLGL